MTAAIYARAVADINTLPPIGTGLTNMPSAVSPTAESPDVIELVARTSSDRRQRPRTAMAPRKTVDREEAQVFDSLPGMAKVVFPQAHTPTWEAMQAERPDGARRLAQMICNAIDANASVDPRLSDTYVKHLQATLALIESEMTPRSPPAPHPFTDRVMALAQDKLWVDDRAILANLVAQYQAEACGLRTIQDIHLPQDAGVCLRAATKWAGCAAIGAAFRYEDMNIAKIDAKYGTYVRESRRKKAAATKGLKGLKNFFTGKEITKAADKVAARFCAQWLQEFRDADRVVHRNAVNVSSAGKLAPSRYLAQHPLQQTEALIVNFRVDRATGGSAHTVAVSGGAQSRLFDSGKDTVFQFERPDVGGSIDQYLRAQYARNGERVHWRLLRVTANP